MLSLYSLATKQSQFLCLLTATCTIASEMVPTTKTQQIETIHMNEDSQDTMEEYQRVRQRSEKRRRKRRLEMNASLVSMSPW